MEKSGIAIFGLGYGDEGKGSVGYYISNKHNIKTSIRFAGGCQGRHTVQFDNNGSVCNFSFSQLSPVVLEHKEANIVITDNFIFEPFALNNELNELSKYRQLDGIHVYVNNGAICVTPIHQLYNRIEERNNQLKEIGARGSIGSGVSIAALGLARYTDDNNKMPVLYASDLNGLNVMHIASVLRSQRDWFIGMCIKNGYELDKEFSILINFDVNIYAHEICNIWEVLIKKGIVHSYNHVLGLISDGESVLFESSQGLLLDKHYGLSSFNCTYVDAGISSLDTYPLEISKVGVIRSISTRHGPGIFPTEDSNIGVKDLSQMYNEFVGEMRFGWFDILAYKYSLFVTNPDIVCMTHLDYLRGRDSIRVCIGYELPTGKRIFEINQSNKRLVMLGGGIKPIYKELSLSGKGFYDKVHTYIGYINSHVSSRYCITLGSFGPGLGDKFTL